MTIRDDDTLVKQPAQQQEPKKDLMWSTVAMQERHDQRIQKVVATLERIKQEQEPHMAVTVNHKQAFAEGLKPALQDQDQGQSCYCPECERLSKELAALKAQQQGWRLVPVKPTDAMLRAAQTAWVNDPLKLTSTMYEAMLNAAQQPAQQQEPFCYHDGRNIVGREKNA